VFTRIKEQAALRSTADGGKASEARCSLASLNPRRLRREEVTVRLSVSRGESTRGLPRSDCRLLVVAEPNSAGHRFEYVQLATDRVAEAVVITTTEALASAPPARKLEASPRLQLLARDDPQDFVNCALRAAIDRDAPLLIPEADQTMLHLVLAAIRCRTKGLPLPVIGLLYMRWRPRLSISSLGAAALKRALLVALRTFTQVDAMQLVVPGEVPTGLLRPRPVREQVRAGQVNRADTRTLRKELMAGRKGKLILVPGVLRRGKCLPEILRAWQTLRSHGHVLVLLGSPDEPTARLLDQCWVTELVTDGSLRTVLRWVTDAEIDRYLAAADGTLLANKNSVSSSFYVSSVAVGTPVLVAGNRVLRHHAYKNKLGRCVRGTSSRRIEKLIHEWVRLGPTTIDAASLPLTTTAEFAEELTRGLVSGYACSRQQPLGPRG
jgi:hypothetical protein